MTDISWIDVENRYSQRQSSSFTASTSQFAQLSVRMWRLASRARTSHTRHVSSVAAGAQDRIVLRDLVFRGRHGVLAAERELGQRFEVDLVLYTNHSVAAATDDLEETINYAEVYDQAKSVLEGTPKNLIETVAVDLARKVLIRNKRVDRVDVTLRKPQVPIHGILAYAAVEVSRNRRWLNNEEWDD